MFTSDPICILSAGATIDGREIGQHIIDEMAATYDPNVYTARIRLGLGNSGEALGSVTALEKKGNKLYAILKPNSKLLHTVEQGQFLHAACEYRERFANTGKTYLTGLMLTDRPASLGTTQIHLSAGSGNNSQLLYSNVLMKSTAHEGEVQISDLEHQLAVISEQVETLTEMANVFMGKLDEDEEEEMYL